jgi:mannose-6-phosphate isomerase-like protein (cupin superfamily)
MLLAGPLLAAQRPERRVEPTFIRRSLSAIAEQPSELSAPGVHYRPIFGSGDADAGVPRGLARFGELLLDPGASTANVAYQSEEQAYLVTEGRAALLYPDGEHGIQQGDFLYLPPGARHGVTNGTDKPCRILIVGVRVRGDAGPPPPKLLAANLSDVKKQSLPGHPVTTLFQMLIGDHRGTRDFLAAGHTLNGMSIIEFAPGTGLTPHHHEMDEEAYLVLEGQGEVIAGSGMDGYEGRHPVKAGDAYFFRLNCTLGFTNTGTSRARILSVRWQFPFPRRAEAIGLAQ